MGGTTIITMPLAKMSERNIVYATHKFSRNLHSLHAIFGRMNAQLGHAFMYGQIKDVLCDKFPV